MNEQQPNRSEKIASNILRTLAIIGLVAILVLATWVVVQGSRFLPNAGKNIASAVSAVTSIFSSAPAESLLFELDKRTFAVNETASIAWTYTGETAPQDYSFSYACGTDVYFQVLDTSEASRLECDTKYSTKSSSIQVKPLNDKTRFADVTLTVTAGKLLDTTVVTVVNSDILISRATETATTSPETKTEVNQVTSNKTPVATTPSKTPTNIITPQQTQKVVTTVVPSNSGPADLVLNIEETGVLVKVSGKNTFFPISPIPDNKVAAVTFTVTNRGGETSKPWSFKAELPVEGDSDYKYTSPTQSSLEPGMQVTYTLGFDEVLQSNKGTILLTLVPTDSKDKKTNNIDSVVVQIDSK